MKDYLRWSLQQFYLIYFWPIRFAREVEGDELGEPRLLHKERVEYMNKMLLWIVLISVIANLAIGFTCEKWGIVYLWKESWAGLTLGVSSGVAGGVAGRVAGGVVFGVVFGVAFGVESGVAFGVKSSAASNPVGGMALGAAHGLFFGGLRGAESGVAVGRASGAVSGVIMFAASGLLERVVFGLVGVVGRALLFGAISGAAGKASRSMTQSRSFSVWFGVLGVVAFGLVGGVVGGLAFGAAFWLSYFRLFSYPLDAALSLVAYLDGKQNPQAIKRAWRLCPVTWNEVIWLPLPFAAKLLTMLTMQDREEGFRQIAFVAAERELQKRVALHAVEEIAINEMQATSINRLADVPQKLEWTTDASVELSEVLASAFPRFERTAQYAGQYLILHSDHRKGEALKQALAELAGLQKSLIAARGRLSPRLLKIANEWRALLEAEQKTFVAKSAATLEIPNPFAFGNALGETKDNIFVGRQDVVRKIEDSILGTKQMPTLLLQGARRMGKSSILNQLPRMLGPNFAPVVIDCQEAAIRESIAATLRYLSRAICAGLQRRRVKYNPLTRQALKREPFSVFKDWLEDVEQVLPQGLRVLLCFDEYERLQETLDAGWGHGLLDTLRNWIQHHPHLVLMFTGVHDFEELGPTWTDRFISARRMRVSFLAREDLELLLTKPIPEFDLDYTDGALDAIIHTTSGQPFLTQAVAFELVQYLNEQRRKEAAPEDVEEAVAHALISGSAYFANVWTDAREQGQAILTAIAGGDMPPDYPVARAWLRENDVLNEAGDFAVPMVRRWVRETKFHQNSVLLKK